MRPEQKSKLKFIDVSGPKVVESSRQEQNESLKPVKLEILNPSEQAVASMPGQINPVQKRKRRRANHPLYGWPPTAGPLKIRSLNPVCMR